MDYSSRGGSYADGMMYRGSYDDGMGYADARGRGRNARRDSMGRYSRGGRYGGYHHFTDTSENCGLECYNNIFTLIKEAIESIR